MSEMSARRRQLTERRAEAARLRRSGLTIAEIATRMGVSDRTVWRYLPQELKLDPHPQVTPEQREIILELAADGCPRNEIARTVGLSDRTVSRIAPATARRGELSTLIPSLERIPDNLHDIRAMRKSA